MSLSQSHSRSFCWFSKWPDTIESAITETLHTRGVSVWSLSPLSLKGGRWIGRHYWHRRCADVSPLPAEVHVAERDTAPTKTARRRAFVFTLRARVCARTRATVCVMPLAASPCVHNAELTAGAAEISSFSSFRSLWKQSKWTTAAGTTANGYLSPRVIVSPWIPPAAHRIP